MFAFTLPNSAQAPFASSVATFFRSFALSAPFLAQLVFDLRVVDFKATLIMRACSRPKLAFPESRVDQLTPEQFDFLPT